MCKTRHVIAGRLSHHCDLMVNPAAHPLCRPRSGRKRRGVGLVQLKSAALGVRNVPLLVPFSCTSTSCSWPSR